MPSHGAGQTSARIVTDGGTRTIPEDDDVGKNVVDMRGREIGMVEDAEGDTMHVDPDPSLTESIKSKRGIGGHESGALPVTPEFVDRIGDDVVLDVKRDEEFQQETG